MVVELLEQRERGISVGTTSRRSSGFDPGLVVLGQLGPSGRDPQRDGAAVAVVQVHS